MTNETQTKKIEILVVEDTPIHQESARILLAGHNVEIVGTYDEALDRVYGESCYAINKSSPKKKYDVILTDMFFPQGRGDCVADKSQASVEQPFGYALAQIACMEGTPYVGIVSDANHHGNGIGYSMDPLNEKVMNVNGSRYCVFNNSYKTGMESILVKADGSSAGSTYALRASLKEDPKMKEKGITDVRGFKVEAVEQEGSFLRNRLIRRGNKYMQQVPAEAKDWLGALTYLMTA
jgi:CheY-like chemotaxis protein